MTTILALYKKPTDAIAFDAYYRATHVLLAKAMPGLKTCRRSTGPLQALSGGEKDLHLVAMLEFESAAAS